MRTVTGVGFVLLLALLAAAVASIATLLFIMLHGHMKRMTRPVLYTFVTSTVSRIPVFNVSGANALPRPFDLGLVGLAPGTSFVSGCVLPWVALRDRTNLRIPPASGIAPTLFGVSLVSLPVWVWGESSTRPWRTSIGGPPSLSSA